MLTPVNAVLFDLDGTLVDSIPLILASYAHTLATHVPGYEPGRRVIVRNLGRALDAILRDYAVAARVGDPEGVSRAMLDTYRAFQRANIDRLIRPYPGMNETLAGLRERGLTLGVVTSKTEAAARDCYERYGIDAFLSVQVFHGDTVRHKPDPDPLLLAASRTGVPVERTVYVGDSVQDMAAGRAAGMRTIGVLWGPSEREDLVQAGADEIAERPAELLTIVG